MLLAMLILYYAKALPEAFKLSMIADSNPQNCLALAGAEADTRFWAL